MVRIMKETGIKTDNLLIQKDDWYTHTYAKPYIDDRELNRVDFGNYNVLSQETADRLIDNLKNEIYGSRYCNHKPAGAFRYTY